MWYVVSLRTKLNLSEGKRSTVHLSRVQVPTVTASCSSAGEVDARGTSDARENPVLRITLPAPETATFLPWPAEMIIVDYVDSGGVDR